MKSFVQAMNASCMAGPALWGLRDMVSMRRGPGAHGACSEQA